MGEGSPLVSIIVRTKDRPKLLRKALQSIAAQNYRPIEVVLVNDGGCDLDTEGLMTTLGDVSCSYLRLEKNTGRSHAGNVGIDNATGEYVGFLDDDDEFYPDHVSVLTTGLKNTGYKIAYSDSEIVFGSYNFDTMDFAETERRIFFSKDFSMNDLLIDNYITLITILFHKDVLTAEKGFDEQFKAYEDWDLLIRCCQTHPFHHVTRATAKYIQWSRQLQIAQSSEYAELLNGEYDKIIQKHRDKYTPDTARYFRDSFAMLRSVIKENEQKIAGLENTIAERNAHVEDLKRAVAEKEEYIRFIHSGRGWRVLGRYYRVRDRILNMIR